MAENRKTVNAPPGEREGLIELDDAHCATLLPVRDVRSHKGSHGTLLIVAGSLDFAGAALLVARAAGRAGAGVVRLAVPASLQPIFAGRVLEPTTLPLPETEIDGEVDPEAAMERILDLEHEALVVGPGLRPGLATVELVEALLGQDAAGAAPALVDAEGLNSLASLPDWAGRIRRSCVLTPHPGEFERLRGNDGRDSAGSAASMLGDAAAPGADDDTRAALCLAAAASWQQVVVLKGARTVVASPGGRLARAPFENAALATAGTGDVLSGTIGALLAQGLGTFEAACLGVYLHGSAGEAFSERLGDSGLLASDLPDEIARARRRLDLVRERGGRRMGFSRSESTG